MGVGAGLEVAKAEVWGVEYDYWVPKYPFSFAVKWEMPGLGPWNPLPER